MAGPRDRLGYVLALLVFSDTFGYAIVLPLLPLAAQKAPARPEVAADKKFKLSWAR